MKAETESRENDVIVAVVYYNGLQAFSAHSIATGGLLFGVSG